MKPSYLHTQIFLDSGNPVETHEAIAKLGFLDGQTTNPSLVAKNPNIVELKNAGTLDEKVIWEKYQTIANEIREMLPKGAISVEVYADHETPYETMLAQARELATWFPGVYVKLPITEFGLKTAQVLVGEGVNVNMTLCFTQEQAAAVHAATRGAERGQVFISPFIGRLDDIGIHGLDLIRNIATMYRLWGSHVMVLGASIRSLDHLFGCMTSGADIITAPLTILESWVKDYGLTKDPTEFTFAIQDLRPIMFRDLSDQDWMLYDIHHTLTDKGIEKFATDWKALFDK